MSEDHDRRDDASADEATDAHDTETAEATPPAAEAPAPDETADTTPDRDAEDTLDDVSDSETDTVLDSEADEEPDSEVSEVSEVSEADAVSGEASRDEEDEGELVEDSEALDDGSDDALDGEPDDRREDASNDDEAPDEAAAREGTTQRVIRTLGELPLYLSATSGLWRDRLLVVLLTALVFLPWLGEAGLWDPWETHYGEVGRQITERNDWISTWWGNHWQDAKGNQEGRYFFSKPILLMWTMAMGMLVFGVNELGVRIGTCLIAILGVALAFALGRSVFGRRAGFLMAGVLGTSPFYFMLSRQAQTDMPFVGLMSVAMCFFMMGAFGKDRREEADRFSYGLSFGWLAAVSIPQLSLLIAGLSRWRGGPSAIMQTITTNPRNGLLAGAILVGAAGLIFVGSMWRWRDGSALAHMKRRRGAFLAALTIWGPLLSMLAVLLITGSARARNLNGWFVWGPTQAGLYATCLGVSIYWILAHPTHERRRLYMLNFYIFAALATLAKGLLGFMLPGCILFFYILITREWRMLKRDAELGVGIPIFIAVSFPWYAGMLIRHTHGFWQRFFVHDHFKRLASGVHQVDTGSFEHFARWVGYGLFPWAALIPAAFGRLFTQAEAYERGDDRSRATLMLVLWAVISFTLFTLSSTKFHHYIFPVIPPLAMLVALALDDALDRELPTPWPLYVVGVALLSILAWDIVDEPRVWKNLFTYKYDRTWLNTGWDRTYRQMMGAVSTVAGLGILAMLVRNRLARRAGVIAIFLSGVALAYYCLNPYISQLSDRWSQKQWWDRYYALCDRVPPPTPRADRRKKYCEQPAIAYKLNWRGENFYTANEFIAIRDDDDFTHFLNTNLKSGDTFYALMESPRYRGEFSRKLQAPWRGRSCVVFNKNPRLLLIKTPCAANDPARVDNKVTPAKR